MIKTTRDAGGNLATETQAMPAPAPSPLSGYLIDMINRRGRESADPSPRGYEQVPRMGRSDTDNTVARPSRMPNLGANGDKGDGRGPMAKPKARLSRLRRVYTPTGVPSLIPSSGYQDQTEYQLDDGSWSMDGTHGTLDTNARIAVEQAANMPTMTNPFPGLNKLSPSGGGTWGLNPDQYKKTFGEGGRR